MEKFIMIEKIKKLIALASSPNEHEAALAMKKASELLAKYNLTMAAIDQTNENNIPTISLIEKNMGNRVPKWIQVIYASIPKIFDCYSLIRKYWDGTQTYMIFGQKEDIQMTQHFCNYFIKIIMQTGKQMTSKTKNRNDFIYGMTITVIHRLQDMYIQMATQQSMALVLANKKKFVNDFINENFKNTKPKNITKKTVSRSAYMAGVKAGESIPLHNPVEYHKKKQQII